MTKQTSKFLFLLTAFLVSGIPLLSQKYQIRNYTIDDGLPGSLSLDITQDKDGVIWIASYSGLSRYDGTRFTNFSTANGLSTNGIRNMIYDHDFQLWMGTDNGVSKFDGNKFYNFNHNDSLGKGTVWTSARDSYNHLWFGTQDGGLSFFDGSKFKTYTVETGLISNFIYSLFFDSNDELWIGYRNNGISKVKIDSSGNILSVEHFRNRNGLPEFSVRAIVKGNNGLLYFGTRGGGISVFDGTDFHSFDITSGLSSNDVYSLTLSPEGELVVGTNGGGIDFCQIRKLGKDYSFEVTKKISEANGLLMNNVLKLFYDREENLWAALSSGVSKIIKSKFVNYTKNEGLIDNLIYSVYADQDHSIWFGSTKGLTKLETKNNSAVYTNYKIENGLPSEEIRSILRDSYGNLWIGTAIGLCRLEKNNTFKVFTTKNGLPGNYVLDIYEDHNKKLWVSVNGGVSVFDPKSEPKFTSYTLESGLNSSVIYSSYQDKKGDIWIATSADGLNVFDGVKFKSYTTKDGLPNNSVRSFLEDKYGNMWISTSGGGISRLRFKNNVPEFSNFSVPNGLNSATIVTLIEDADGFIWAGGNFGIDKLDPQYDPSNPDHAKLVLKHYDKKNGTVGNEVTTSNACTIDLDGNFWFCFVEGVTKYNPAEKIEITPKPTIILNRFSVNDTLNFLAPFSDNHTFKNTSPISESGKEISLNDDQNNIRFEYAGLSFKREDNLKYQYKLIGYDQNWSELTELNFKEYTNLPHGKYSFEVNVKNIDGLWSENPAVIRFQIKPAFWNTAWFKILVILLLISIILFVFKIRTDNINKRNKQLEKLVQNRTQELSNYSQKLEVTNQELKEVNQLKTELLSIAAHDLKNPLTAILNYSQLISGEAENQVQTIKRAQAVQKITDQMISTINALLNMSAIENGQLKLHLDDVNILKLIESVIYYNMANAHSKNQTLDFSYNPQHDYLSKIDDHKMKEVFDNLVSNAIKFSPYGTKVKISLNRNTQFIVLEVSDEGPGFSESDKRKLFGRFQRLTARPTAGESSTGLGLSIAKQLVELHKGEIVLESELGKGAKFIVRLPVFVPLIS